MINRLLNLNEISHVKCLEQDLILRHVPGGPVAKTLLPVHGVLGLIPGQGIRSYMLQLRVRMLQLRPDLVK